MGMERSPQTNDVAGCETGTPSSRNYLAAAREVHMTTRTHYVVTVLDDDGDVIDTHNCDSLDEAQRIAVNAEGIVEIERVGETLNAPNGRVIRQVWEPIEHRDWCMSCLHQKREA